MEKRKAEDASRNALRKEEDRRGYVSQTDLPKHTLNEALRLAQSLWADFAGKSAQPHQLAMSVDLSPTSSRWRDLCGSSIGYGLTEGGYNAAGISLTDLGKRIVAPEVDADDVKARAEAVLKPRICRDFFSRYNRAKFPSDKIAVNVLISMGVPNNRASTGVELLKHNGEATGIIHQTKTGPYIAVDDPQSPAEADPTDQDEPGDNTPTVLEGPNQEHRTTKPPGAIQAVAGGNHKVFISHGKDRSITTQIKEILTFGKFDPVVSVEKESTAIPVPDKVFQDMRSCAAAVIHVMSEGEFIAPSGEKAHRLNENVLIEIGAAIALCGKNVVLLVEKGTPLPTNLQGLYRCEYEGDKLDYEATMKLLKTFNGFEMT